MDLSRRVAHRENALFALVRDIRGDIHQKYNAQYRGDIYEYRAISRNIARYRAISQYRMRDEYRRDIHEYRRDIHE